MILTKFILQVLQKARKWKSEKASLQIRKTSGVSDANLGVSDSFLESITQKSKRKVLNQNKIWILTNYDWGVSDQLGLAEGYQVRTRLGFLDLLSHISSKKLVHHEPLWPTWWHWSLNPWHDTAWWQRQMCVNDFCKVTLDSAAAGIEPAISNRKSNAITTAPPRHTVLRHWHATWL